MGVRATRLRIDGPLIDPPFVLIRNDIAGDVILERDPYDSEVTAGDVAEYVTIYSLCIDTRVMPGSKIDVYFELNPVTSAAGTFDLKFGEAGGTTDLLTASIPENTTDITTLSGTVTTNTQTLYELRFKCSVAHRKLNFHAYTISGTFLAHLRASAGAVYEPE